MRPETVSPIRCQGQFNAQPQATVQAQAHLCRAAGKHAIQGTDEVAQVVGSGNDAGGTQADLTFAEQMRQLWRQGKAADTHGHHQGDKTGE
ncbi:hypothetical protein D9M71_378690 [compost metagenome]